MPFERVVVGADDSQTARQAVLIAAEVAKLVGDKLHIVTSYNPKTISQAGLPEEFRYLSTVHPADALLDDLSRIVTDRGLEPVLHSSYGGPVESIVRIAEEIDADLIVVGNKGMKGARRVLGSIPNSVAHTAPCSVLIADTVAAVGESD